ncbi:CA050-like protein, partial [Mya arenaria]
MADEFTKATCGSKLMVIADQIRYLQEQAKKVLEEAKRDAMMHHAACNLVKKPGQIYYLYEPFKLEHDMSWTPYDKIEQRSQDFAFINKVMNAQHALVDAEAPNFKGLTLESRNSSSVKLTDLP